MDDTLEEYRRYLRQKLHELHMEFHDRAKPIIDNLVEIESLRPPNPMIFTAAEWAKCGDLKKQSE